MLKRIIAILMCLILTASSVFLVACDNGTDNSFSDSPETSTDGFLNEAKNWNGEVVKILGYNGEYTYHSVQIDTQEKNDDPVNNAFYDRNALIKEQYGIDIEVVLPNVEDDPIDILTEDIESGLGEYQVAVIPIVYLAPLAKEGLLKDFNSIENGYLHLDQPWWDKNLIDDLNVNDKVYFLAGDALVEDDEATWAVYFNKDLLAAYSLEDPYDLVRQGKWTMDKMYEMAQKIGKTTNYASTKFLKSRLEGGDQWGMVAQCYDFIQLMQGGEQTLVDNSGETPVLRVLEQDNVDTFNTLAEIFYDSANCGVAEYYASWTPSVYDQEKQIFAIGNALFMPGSITVVSQALIREAEIHYGILPLPKRNEEQANYSGAATVYHCSVISVPVTNQKLDVTCYALEAMAFHGKEIVTPKYYERLLTLNFYGDNGSAEMFDLIFRNRSYDMGAVFNFGDEGNGAGTLYFYIDLLGSLSTEIDARFNSKKNLYESSIEEFVATCYN